MQTTARTESEWLNEVSDAQPIARELLGATADAQKRAGYFHTLREIFQQPSTWLHTAETLAGYRDELRSRIDGIETLVLTGSGSSEYAGDCVRLPLQNELRIATQAIGGGAILTHGLRAIPPQRPGLVVSLARSGDSPESVGALDLLLQLAPDVRHLVLTCNRNGRLATTYRDDSRVGVIALDDRVNDRSLAMTSSFTNMVLAARFLGLLDEPARYRRLCEQLSRAAEEIIRDRFDALARAADMGFRRAVFLGSGSRFGAAREASLKMLEMTGGRVGTVCETFLGFRHGPMSYVNDGTLLVCFLSSDPLLRAYEADLLRELDRKKLGMAKLIFGEGIDTELVRDGDVVIPCEMIGTIGDENAPVLDVLIGQLLAFFRCRNEGLRPDSPSEEGVIHRVVESFTLHGPPEQESV